MIDKLLKLLRINFAGEFSLKDGTVVYCDGEMEAGVQVWVQSPDGKIPMPNGDYELSTGQILSVEDGKIKEITDVVDTTETPDNEVTEPQSSIEVEVEAVETPEVEDIPVVDKTGEPPVELFPIGDIMAKLEEIMKRIEALESKLMMNDQKEEEFRAEIDFIKNKALTQELKKSKEIEEKPISRIDIIRNLKNNK